MSVSGAYDDGFEDAPRESALICWPVEFLGGVESAPKVSGLHCTVAYWPEVGMTQDEMLSTITRYNAVMVRYYRQWRLANISGVDAFGELKDYPVLLVENEQPDTTLKHMHETIADKFYAVGHPPDNRFRYNPHISVDLRTIVKPPKQVVFRPMELWYKDEKPVIV
jgi:hypothetical protein